MVFLLRSCFGFLREGQDDFLFSSYLNYLLNSFSSKGVRATCTSRNNMSFIPHPLPNWKKRTFFKPGRASSTKNVSSTAPPAIPEPLLFLSDPIDSIRFFNQLKFSFAFLKCIYQL